MKLFVNGRKASEHFSEVGCQVLSALFPMLGSILEYMKLQRSPLSATMVCRLWYLLSGPCKATVCNSGLI